MRPETSIRCQVDVRWIWRKTISEPRCVCVLVGICLCSCASACVTCMGTHMQLYHRDLTKRRHNHGCVQVQRKSCSTAFVVERMRSFIALEKDLSTEMERQIVDAYVSHPYALINVNLGN